MNLTLKNVGHVATNYIKVFVHEETSPACEDPYVEKLSPKIKEYERHVFWKSEPSFWWEHDSLTGKCTSAQLPCELQPGEEMELKLGVFGKLGW